MSFGRFHTDGTLAFFLFVLSVTFSVLQYGSLLKLERPESPVDSIPLGERHFRITSRGMCVGGLEVVVSNTEDYEIQGRGLVHVHFGGADYDIRLSLTSAFNSFGQLAAALLRFETDDFDLKIGLREVNPIYLDVIARSGDKSFRQRHTFPGPLLLVPQGEDHFQFRYRFTPVEFASTGPQTFQPLLQTLDLHTEEFEGKAPEDLQLVCAEEAAGYLALDFFAEKVGKLFSFFWGASK
ncbi:MAG: hypothetical protein KDD55_08810 [Bdellovibrionales bacterium]|nr:hypothetical protein [Bdellovibrionales bacterium]